ncbi:MAG TPA: hypothetical protein IAA90_02795 [Candidatus Ornithoclostridium excrementipullorum]|nr:hypothetical protein [Candidatus Ornithoclostridium excrementipullorum]
MSLFTKIDEIQILPSRKNLVGTIIISVAAILLYFVVSVFYIISCCNAGFDGYIIISIIEMIINVVSIIVCLIATYVSDIFIKNCVNSIERLEKASKSSSIDDKYLDLRHKLNFTDKLLIIKIIFSILFIFYIATNIAFTIISNDNDSAIHIVSIVLTSVSALISIILGLISVISCFTVGIYTKILLNALKKSYSDLLHEYNDLRITISHTDVAK